MDEADSLNISTMSRPSAKIRLLTNVPRTQEDLFVQSAIYIPRRFSDESQNRLFANTQLCARYMTVGYCDKASCSFAHSHEELRTAPDLRCTKWCRLVFKGLRCFDKNCPYAHARDELRSNAPALLSYKTALCRYNKKGMCLSGNSCRFAHSLRELREHANNEYDSAHTTQPPNSEEMRTQRSIFDSQTHEDVMDHLAMVRAGHGREEHGGETVNAPQGRRDSGFAIEARLCRVPENNNTVQSVRKHKKAPPPLSLSAIQDGPSVHLLNFAEFGQPTPTRLSLSAIQDVPSEQLLNFVQFGQPMNTTNENDQISTPLNYHNPPDAANWAEYNTSAVGKKQEYAGISCTTTRDVSDVYEELLSSKAARQPNP